MENDSSTPPIQPTIPAPPVPDPNQRDARNWAMWCHLSALAGFVGVPFGTIAGPLLVWQLKKDQFPNLNEHGREAVNFQLSLLIYILGGAIAAFIGSFFCIGFLLFPLLGAAAIAGMILTIIAGVKANEGVLYQYPMNLRLMK
jgi:uncharacterized Tic20 family protein